MQPISVVIICRDEEQYIGKVLESVSGLTDDIVVYDNGSTDRTMTIARSFGAQVHTGTWEGYGLTKNKANKLARYDWILSLDADESVDEQLKAVLNTFSPENEKTVYQVARRSFLGNRPLRFGEWGKDRQSRLFNRQFICWDDAAVHESLVLPPGTVIKKLGGFIEHRTMRDIQDYAEKITRYAMLGARQYYQRGKKASWVKIHLAPGFSFLKNYFFRLGFLDGHPGYVCAKMTAVYTFLKYTRLKELQERKPG